jgi:uncharacterized protein (DUF4415 family)
MAMLGLIRMGAVPIPPIPGTPKIWFDGLGFHTYTVNMNGLRFERDNRKSRDNKRKHGVSFEEAQTVFLDENALRYYDPDHSADEDRFLLTPSSALTRRERRIRKSQRNTKGDAMRANYDFAKMKGERNPYLKQLKQPITIRLDTSTVAYFKALAGDLGIPYQNLINLYLRDCALSRRKLELKWAAREAQYGTPSSRRS